MNSENFTLRMRAEPVPWFGLCFSWLSMLLGIEKPALKKTIIELVPRRYPFSIGSSAWRGGDRG